MIKKIILIVLLFVNTGCGMKNWKPVDQALFTAYTAGNIVDILQTREIMRDDNGYHECNSVLNGLSRNQATGVMIGINAGLYFLADAFPKIRTPVLGGATIVKWGLVIHNHGIGVRMKW